MKIYPYRLKDLNVRSRFMKMVWILDRNHRWSIRIHLLSKKHLFLTFKQSEITEIKPQHLPNQVHSTYYTVLTHRARKRSTWSGWQTNCWWRFESQIDMARSTELRSPHCSRQWGLQPHMHSIHHNSATDPPMWNTQPFLSPIDATSYSVS